MIKSKSLSVVFAIVIFVIGLVCGIFADRILLAHKMFPFPGQMNKKQEKRMMEHMIKKFSRHLDLSKEQKIKLEQIFSKHKDKMDALAKEVRPKFKNLRDKIGEEIKTILNEKQKAIFEKITKERKEHGFDKIERP